MVKRWAQSTVEYVVIVSIVIAAITAMRTYFKRGIQAGIKQVVDNVTNIYDANGTLLVGGQAGRIIDLRNGTLVSANYSVVSPSRTHYIQQGGLIIRQYNESQTVSTLQPTVYLQGVFNQSD